MKLLFTSKTPVWVLGFVLCLSLPVGAEEHQQSIGGALGNTTLSGYIDTTGLYPSGGIPVPEPSSVGMMAAALLAAGFLIHRRRG